MLAYLPTSGDPATSLLFRLQMNTGIRKCKWTFFSSRVLLVANSFSRKLLKRWIITEKHQR